MFEQTFVNRTDTVRRPWPMAFSIALQCALTGALLLGPLLRTAQLAFHPAVALVFVPARPAPPTVVRQQATTAATVTVPLRQVFRPVFTGPRKVPASISTLPDPVAPDLFLTNSVLSSSAIPSGVSGLVVESGPAPLPIAVPPKPALPATPARVRVGGGVQAAKLLHQAKPEYPQLARAARISGTVHLQAIIGRDGTIRNLQLIGGPPLLVAAALHAVSQWVYKPTLLNGEPVEVFTEIDVNFTLSQ